MPKSGSRSDKRSKKLKHTSSLADVPAIMRQAGPDHRLSAEQLRNFLDVSSLGKAPGAAALFDADALPPSCNTGVDTNRGPGKGDKQALVDYLRFTIKPPPYNQAQPINPNQETEHLSFYLNLLGGDVANWNEKDRGFYGYTHSHWCGGCAIFSGGSEPGMGFCVQLSGQGCRELEHRMVEGLKIGPMRCSGWPSLLSLLLEGHCPGNAAITRLDVALDDFTGTLDMEVIQKHVKENLYACRGGVQIVEGTINEAENVRVPVRVIESRGRGSDWWGTTVYFGRKSSSTSMRFYDKVAERANAGVEVAGEWVRAEYEAHDERAVNLARAIVDKGLECVPQVMRGYVDFKAPHGYDAKNRYKAPSADWWDTFLGGWEKMLLTLRPITRTIEKARGWIEAQVQTTLAMIYDTAIIGGVGQLLKYVEDGRANYRPKHRSMIAAEGARTDLFSPGPTGF